MKEPLPLASSAVINDTRRGLIKRFAVATIGISSVALAAITSSRAKADSHLAQLDETSVQAKALGYRHDIANVDTLKYPRSQGDNKVCSNCQLYSTQTGDGWGACPIFAGRLVRGNGWCSAWIEATKS